MDPLIVSRGDIVEKVALTIAEKSMPKRRYAIAFLGNSGRRGALQPLRRVLEDESEDEFVRGDALGAIAMIVSAEGRRSARVFSTSTANYLREVAREIESGMVEERRSYERALRSYLCVEVFGCA